MKLKKEILFLKEKIHITFYYSKLTTNISNIIKLFLLSQNEIN